MDIVPAVAVMVAVDVFAAAVGVGEVRVNHEADQPDEVPFLPRPRWKLYVIDGPICGRTVRASGRKVSGRILQLPEPCYSHGSWNAAGTEVVLHLVLLDSSGTSLAV